MKTFEVDAQEDSKSRSDKQTGIVENFFTGSIVPHNYQMAHNGSKYVTFAPKGVALVVNGKKTLVEGTLYNYELVWDPTSQYFAFMTMKKEGHTLRLVDTIDPENPRVKDLYTMSQQGNLIGIEWSPRGGEIYWIETERREPEGEIHFLKRIDINSKRIVTLVESVKKIDFFMPPVTWFEHGQGPTTKNYSIVYGTDDGLFLLDRGGGKPRVLCQAPATGVNNLEWSPDGKYIVMFFRRSFKSDKLGDLRGVMLAHLTETDPLKVMENLYEGTNIHTLWFSPDGKYVTWAKETGCWYRKPEDRGKEATKVPNPVIEDKDGKKTEITDKTIKGCHWNESSTRLAITAGNQVWVHNAPVKKTELFYEFGDNPLAFFAAEPRWRGDKLILTVFEDTALTGREVPRALREGSGAAGPGADAPAVSEKQESLKKIREKIKEQAAQLAADKDKKKKEAEKKLKKEGSTPPKKDDPKPPKRD